MRIIGRFLDKRDVGELVDTLRNVGYDRKDMIISDSIRKQSLEGNLEDVDEIIFIKTEREGLGETGLFYDGIKGLKSNDGILVAVEAPKHHGNRIKQIMERFGAEEIVQD
jgi:mannitol/fructose-specific phosphotransferase system IIA component (Ntr-type)